VTRFTSLASAAIVKPVAYTGDFSALVTLTTGPGESLGLPSESVMSRLFCPILLALSIAFPSATLALGLGDLHVESALHQGFVAHIDLIDASPEDVARLSAGIAGEDAFQRYQLERPGFLAGTTVAVGQDAQGRPILLLRSTESFTEPVVTFLVDLHWPGGELIREYTALLDPPELEPKAPDAAPAVVAPPPRAPVAQTTRVAAPTPGAATTPVAAPTPDAATTPAAAPTPDAATARAAAPTPDAATTHVAAPTPDAATTHVAAPTQDTALTPDPKPRLRSYTVARGDTMARIAIIAGARSRRERYRMMVAIYRANPSAFQTNLNALHSGAVLRLPSAEELAAIPTADADREYKAQLATWRMTGSRLLRAGAGTTGARAPRTATASKTQIPNSPIDSKQDTAALEADRLALTHRVESLEQSMQEIRGELQQIRAQQAASPRAPAAPPAAPAAQATQATQAARATQAAQAAQAAQATPKGTRTQDEGKPRGYRSVPFMALVAGLGLMLAMGIWTVRRRWGSDDRPAALQTGPNSIPQEPTSVMSAEIAPAEALTPGFAASSPLPGELARASAPTTPSSLTRVPPPDRTATPMQEPLASAAAAEAPTDEHAAKLRPVPAATAPEPFREQQDTGETTAILAPEIEEPGDTVEQKFSFYNPQSHADTMHVVVGSELKQPPAFVERRKNPTTVLLQAIEREPHRSDLHLKLLELYYAAASENRRAFLEATRQIIQNKDLVSAEVWARVSDMGREIAPDDRLFSDDLDDQAVA
jgi:FimV-like protein